MASMQENVLQQVRCDYPSFKNPSALNIPYTRSPELNQERKASEIFSFFQGGGEGSSSAG